MLDRDFGFPGPIPKSDGPTSIRDISITDSHLPSPLEKLKEKKEPTLGERNPLITAAKLDNPEAIAALKLVTTGLIERKGGLQPFFMESAIFWDAGDKSMKPRLVIRFETPSLTNEQLTLLEQAVKLTYGPASRTRTDSQGKLLSTELYPPPERARRSRGIDEEDEEEEFRRINTQLGWYMGSYTAPLSGGHEGLYVYKDLGDPGMAQYFLNKNPGEWFTDNHLVNPYGKPLDMRYKIEIRDASAYQTDVIKLAVQVGMILGAEKIEDDPELLYEIYNDLNRLGLKRADSDSIYGLDDQLDRIRRVLFEPLANIGLSQGINLNPGSVLQVGVPGTGKTLTAEYFLGQDTGVFLVPIDTLQLVGEMSEPPEKKRLLPRISQVFRYTGRPVVLQLDDIEEVTKDEQTINSVLLNLMAGIRASGFYVLASTNHPEKISPQLIQPERFAHLIYFGLPDAQVRRGILEIHAGRVSKELQRPLFDNDEERDAILNAIAEKTEGYTSRYLWDICTNAKTFFVHRLASQLGRRSGLTEEDLVELFTPEDWIKGFLEAEQRYDKREYLEWDKRIRKVVAHHGTSIGFATGSAQNHRETELEEAIRASISNRLTSN